jgi:hypothetical protein
MTAAAMVAEFDDVAGWTADAVRRLGDRYAIPAACRGSSSPTALAWLARHRENRAYALAARQGRRLAGLFDGGHLSMQLIHATRQGRTA